MQRRDYPVAFPAQGAAKDARLVGALAAAAGVDASVIDAAAALLEEAVARGLGEDDMAAVYEAVRAPLAGPDGHTPASGSRSSA
jgi:3-hydroxyisobutyrate dehydrogenase